MALNIFTHLGISRGIMAAIERNLDIKLDKIGFMLGNIRPDLDSRLSSIPHLKKAAMDFVSSEIQNLLAADFKTSKDSLREFSERLGIITHYLSDFFCYAHSEHFTGNMLKHYMYENRLSIYCRKNRAAAWGQSDGKALGAGADHSSICGYIDSMHGEYIRSGSKPSHKRDMGYTMEITSVFCIAVIRACMRNEIGAAA